MLKIYEINGRTYRYEEGEQPAHAVEVATKQAEVENKAPKKRSRRKKVEDAD